MTAPDYIDNHSAVVDFCGYWPSFHDAKVRAYKRPTAKDPSLSFTLHTWRMRDQVDPKGFFVLKDHSLVSFHFDGLSEVDMDLFQSGNILFGVAFHLLDDSALFRVELDSVMDMSGSFAASAGRVVSILPCDSDGKPVEQISSPGPPPVLRPNALVSEMPDSPPAPASGVGW